MTEKSWAEEKMLDIEYNLKRFGKKLRVRRRWRGALNRMSILWR